MKTRDVFTMFLLLEREFKRACAAHWKPEISRWRYKKRRWKPARDKRRYTDAV